MNGSQYHLLKTRRFLPLLVTVLLGAANDNVFKNALLILILFSVGREAPMEETVLVTVASAIFILPFFIFSATAGQLADKYEKSGMIRWIKFAEVLIMGAGVAALQFGDVYWLLGVLFLMGVQSAFFGPLKYSILPTLLRKDELIGGNAFVEAGTFLAILVGTIVGGLMAGWEYGVNGVAAIVFGLAVIGWICSYGIPQAPAPQPSLKVNYNIATQTFRIVDRIRKDRPVFRSILGISWFWLVGIMLLTQVPNLAKSNFNADHEVITFLMVVATVGIAIGSMLCNSLLKGEITAKYVPVAAFGMSVFLADIWFSSPDGLSSTAVTFGMFLETSANWRVIADLLGVCICGGIFAVPLYAMMQTLSDEQERSQIVAGNNILNAVFMVAGSLLAGIILDAGYTVPDLFLTVAAANLLVVFYMQRFWRGLDSNPAAD
ncbi:MAG: MFS transporter [Rhodospirillaceae bacterium]|nr:MFS transporter [Rhodospirillaceae bacterium]